MALSTNDIVVPGMDNNNTKKKGRSKTKPQELPYRGSFVPSSTVINNIPPQPQPVNYHHPIMSNMQVPNSNNATNILKEEEPNSNNSKNILKN